MSIPFLFSLSLSISKGSLGMTESVDCDFKRLLNQDIKSRRIHF